ncbi:MAG: hypothetical protein J6Q92_05340 [Oscillospiraceae bacterium]|nr:hypothetical protein [Oscillospiraceae bacterium]
MTEIIFTDVSLEAGKLIISVPPDQMGAAYSFIRKKKNKRYALTIKEHNRKRSTDANAKLWAILGEMSTVLHIPPEEIYQGYIPDVGGNYWIIPVKVDAIGKVSEDWCRGHIGRMVDDMGPCMSKDLQGYHNLKLYRGSSEYDSATFSRLLELVMQDCRQIGIEVLSEREKSLLLEGIDEKRNKGNGHN